MAILRIGRCWLAHLCQNTIAERAYFVNLERIFSGGSDFILEPNSWDLATDHARKQLNMCMMKNESNVGI